jgi:hypothetical protein
MRDGTDACLIAVPVMEFSSTISGVEVETASVLEELSVLENVVRDAGGLQGVIRYSTATQEAFRAPVIPLVNPSFAPCAYSFRCNTVSSDLSLICDNFIHR